MKRYWKYVKPYLAAFIIGPLLMIVEVLGEVLLPKFMANIINIGAANKDVPYITAMGGAMVVTALLMMLGGIGGAYFAAKASISFAADVRSDVFDKVQKFSFANLDQFSTGSLVTRLTNDITQVQNLLNMALRMMLRAPGMLIGALIMAFMMNAQLALVVLVVMPVLVILIGIIIKIAFPRFEIMQKKLDALNSTIQEVLTNVRVIKSFVREGYEEKRFAKANEDLKESSLNAFKVVILNMPVMMLLMNVTTLGIVWFGGRQILAGTMPVGDLTAFTTYIVQILMSLMMLAMVLLQSSRALASLHRITEVLDTEVSLTDDGCKRPEKKVESGQIEFKDVSFRYYKDNKEAVLSHIDFKVESGQVLGIIGSTGSGKSTLVQMIPRLYDVDEGEVFVDGVNVKDYSLKNLRDGVGMVLQKNVLFSGTILENLMWGDSGASKEELLEASRAAQADPFVGSFTEGYLTELGQGGVNVSGGQKQRLCIARALLKKSKILILDDSTSAVDTATEARIRESFNKNLKDATKIIIAQRITSVMEADQILVMDEGKIVGIGSHDQLLKTCEPYQEIYYSQMDKEVSA
ncbi:ABC transporter ATP-binding protein [Lachnospiraceae bacterium]|jgi:ATP-binding cassette subfamily B protein|nr:ABC transporter ATP-binding protein [Lachnospiraceae bacterium]